MAKSILIPVQTKILTALSRDPLFVRNYFLTGGTALSEFYLHHRLSEDLDFFSPVEIDKIWLNTLAGKISQAIKAKKDIHESFNRNLVFFSKSGSIIKTEFTFFPFPPVEKPKKVNGIFIDSEIDIATNKFFTIYQKPSARHFIDLYLLLTTRKHSWERLEKLARVKFDTAIDPIQLGSQLVKAETVSDLPKMMIKLPEKEWRNFFLGKAKSLKPRVSR